MNTPVANGGDVSGKSWHRRLYEASYTIFESDAPGNPDAWQYSATIALAVVYLLAGAAACLALNAATLPFGVYVDPPWMRQARFRLLRLPNGLPVLVLSCIALGSYAILRNALAHGLLATVSGVVLTFVLGISSFALVIGANTLLAARRGP